MLLGDLEPSSALVSSGTRCCDSEATLCCTTGQMSLVVKEKPAGAGGKLWNQGGGEELKTPRGQVGGRRSQHGRGSSRLNG